MQNFNAKETELDVHFELTLDDIEKVFDEERAKGKNVRAFLLNNPQNPLGKVFDKQLVVGIMKFCQRYTEKIHSFFLLSSDWSTYQRFRFCQK